MGGEELNPDLHFVSVLDPEVREIGLHEWVDPES
jgi:hypothetical protein